MISLRKVGPADVCMQMRRKEVDRWEAEPHQGWLHSTSRINPQLLTNLGRVCKIKLTIPPITLCYMFTLAQEGDRQYVYRFFGWFQTKWKTVNNTEMCYQYSSHFVSIIRGKFLEISMEINSIREIPHEIV